jgi:transposase-like protein
MAKASIAEAARRLGISQDTVRKRLRLGELAGEQVRAPGGFRWLVELPGEHAEPQGQGETPQEGITREAPYVRELVDSLQAQIRAQQEELEARRREVEQLHILLQQAQAALPAPREKRPWWRFWER